MNVSGSRLGLPINDDINQIIDYIEDIHLRQQNSLVQNVTTTSRRYPDIDHELDQLKNEIDAMNNNSNNEVENGRLTMIQLEDDQLQDVTEEDEDDVDDNDDDDQQAQQTSTTSRAADNRLIDNNSLVRHHQEERANNVSANNLIVPSVRELTHVSSTVPAAGGGGSEETSLSLASSTAAFNRLFNSSARFCRKLMNRTDSSPSAPAPVAPSNTVSSRGAFNCNSPRLECLDFSCEGVPIGNRRTASRRPRSADVWLDHKPRTISKLGKAQKLGPKLVRKRSVRKLEYKDTQKSSKYLLTHQQQDEYGEIKTNLIKGDILRSPAGGSNVIFTDIEILRLKSQSPEPSRRAVHDETEQQESDSVIEQRCSIGIEGHRRLKI